MRHFLHSDIVVLLKAHNFYFRKYAYNRAQILEMSSSAEHETFNKLKLFFVTLVHVLILKKARNPGFHQASKLAECTKQALWVEVMIK